MTIAPPAEPEIAEVTEVTETRVAPSRPQPWTRDFVRLTIVRMVFVLAVVAAVVIFFEYPVQQTYFHSRQRQLQADFTKPHKGLANGQAAALLQFPKYGVNLVIVQGDGPGELRSGPGHDPATPLPGKRGNSILYGHRKAWGSPFGTLSQLKKGDFIVTQIRGKITNPLPVVYKVVSIHHVSDTDTQLSGQSKDYRLTLVTGNGSLLSSGELVVTAVSGKQLKPKAHGPALTPQHESPLLNLTLGIAALMFALAVGAGIYLRGRYRLLALLAVVVPLALAGTFALLIDLDLILPALR